MPTLECDRLTRVVDTESTVTGHPALALEVVLGLAESVVGNLDVGRFYVGRASQSRVRKLCLRHRCGRVHVLYTTMSAENAAAVELELINHLGADPRCLNRRLTRAGRRSRPPLLVYVAVWRAL